jgi:hypothetical protein
MQIELDWDDRARLTELLNEQREAVVSGEITGYGQDKDVEIADIDALIQKLN